MTLATSGCLHFLHADNFLHDDYVAGEEVWVLAELREAGIPFAYVDYRTIEKGDHNLYNAIAQRLNLEHAPYPSHEGRGPKTMVMFLDDLVGLSSKQKGIAIFIDSADVLLAEDRRVMFDLIEAFLMQVEDWTAKEKPCHLCFLMEPIGALRNALITAPST